MSFQIKSHLFALSQAGVVSYLGLLQSNGDATRAADAIDAAMTRIMGAGNGFQTFQAHFTDAVDTAKKTLVFIAITQSQLANESHAEPKVRLPAASFHLHQFQETPSST
jgi:hypothetical protein